MINEFKGEFSWLSNFAPCSVTLDTLYYPSTEAAYQAAKTINIDERQAFRSATPALAKRMGKEVTLRDDWKDVKIRVMTDLCTQKFNQEPYKQLLIDTGNREIVEGNYWNDTFWGVCRGRGANHLGKIIMDIRSNL